MQLELRYADNFGKFWKGCTTCGYKQYTKRYPRRKCKNCGSNSVIWFVDFNGNVFPEVTQPNVTNVEQEKEN